MGIKKILAATMTAGIVLSLVPFVSMADSSGWKQDNAGWKYYVAGSGFVSNSWKQINGKWYYFMSSEYMVQGVTDYMIGNIYYNFNSSGACTNPDAKARKITGWFKKTTMFSSSWNYYGSDGELYTDKWLNDGGNWYYFVYDGTMIDYSGFYLDGSYYDFDSNGVCLNPYSPRSTYL